MRVSVVTCVPGGSTGVDGDVELSVALADSGGQVDAVDITVVALAEDDSLERLVEGNGDLHQVLLALDVEAGDLGHVLLRLRPGSILGLRSRGLDVGGGGVVGHGHVVGSVGLLRGRWGRRAVLRGRRLLHVLRPLDKKGMSREEAKTKTKNNVQKLFPV